MPMTNKNSRKGGPRTEAGKQITSRNATKIGVYSRHNILPGEDPQEFARLEALFVEDFRPVGVTEASLVRDLASISWKRCRLERIEHRQLAHCFDAPITSFEQASLGISLKSELYDYVLHPETLDSLDYDELQKSLIGLDFLMSDRIDAPSLIEFRSNWPEAYKFLKQKMEEIGARNPTPESMAKIEQQNSWDGQSRGPVRRQCNSLAVAINQKILALKQRDQIIAAHRRLIDKRLAMSISDERNERAHEHLSRSFYKTLSELRRQQDWRRQREVVDVTPEQKQLAA